MSIDPATSLAFSMHSNKGAYALLLGSGVSRSAEIPTGWEILFDLVRRLAAIEKEDCEPDPYAWYKAKYKQNPDYSALVGALAKSPTERSQLLRSYIQPSEEERERHAKIPQKAHHAIARLVASGHVRVVLTTNFDRLLEEALVVPSRKSRDHRWTGVLLEGGAAFRAKATWKRSSPHADE